MQRMIALAAVLAAAACSKHKADTASGAGHVADTPHTDKVVEALRTSGLKADPFTVVQPTPFGAALCEQGHVQGMELMICEFTDEAGLEGAKKMLNDGWASQNVRTGVTSTSRKTLLSVVDRERSDPNGKSISQIIKAFRAL